ncbi:Uncharacterized membrane protein [Actinopolyspora mzabensis]|uniref:Uncharacterized membrane protein n=1 Tax=Actinopolyspora mzabensis TaxID=995066 RepID=A0A1G9DDP3_ACTMZ|nr:SRPBCC family protein [Actinopolyspora mzabensis]SDK61927.1 Uncharacterized membrane protein [Actinopolyspora mzabensis]
MAESNSENRPGQGLVDELPTGQLNKAAQKLVQALLSRAVGSVSSRVENLTERLGAVAEGGGSGLVRAITGKEKQNGAREGSGALTRLTSRLSSGAATLSSGAATAAKTVGQAVGAGGGGEAGGGSGSDGSSGGGTKAVNIIEEFDVGLPLRDAYNQWTELEDFPTFTRKVENVDQESDEKVNWRARIMWSHRSWESTIIDQIPDTRIVWRSTGTKGSVDGSVTFHDLAPSLTRILLVLEYYPEGFLEKTGNLWRAQGRRVRADLKQIKRHMMTSTILEQDEVEGWRGEIRDSEVVRSHEEALQQEQEEEQNDGEDYYDEEPDAEG